jgi:hypothetical protein
MNWTPPGPPSVPTVPVPPPMPVAFAGEPVKRGAGLELDWQLQRGSSE